MELRIRPAPSGRIESPNPLHCGQARRNAPGARLVCLKIAAAASASLLAGACNEDASGGIQPTAPAAVTADQRIVLHGARLSGVEAPDAPLREVRTLLNVRSPMNYGDYVWDDEGVPPGKVWMVVDLRAQTISVFRGAHEIGTAVTLYGADQKPTPLGRFVVLEKRKDHWSNLYDAPMPYTLRLTNDGVAIHGSTVVQGSATHGCVGVPIDFARRLFEAAKVGDEVLVLRDLRSHVASQAAAS